MVDYVYKDVRSSRDGKTHARVSKEYAWDAKRGENVYRVGTLCGRTVIGDTFHVHTGSSAYPQIVDCERCRASLRTEGYRF